jgi:hypothetical protein
MIKMKLWAKVAGVALIAVALFIGYLALPKKPVINHTTPSHQVIINPKPTDITSEDTVTNVTHHVTIPPGITEPTTVVDTVTSSDGTQTNNGNATVTPNPNGGYEVTIPEQIVIKEPEYRFKIVHDFQNIGAGYEMLQYKKFSLDGLVYLDKAGIGISYNAYHGIHVGVEETIKYSDGSFQTKAYVSIPLAIQ